MQFRVLGPVEIDTGGRQVPLTRRQVRCLLAILLLHPRQVVPAGRLCALLWPGEPGAAALPLLRSAVARLRAVLAEVDAAVEAVPGGYRLLVDPDTVDAHRFRGLVDRAAATADPGTRDGILRDALSLWRGPALYGAADDELRERLCADLEELRLRAVEESLAVAMELGRQQDVIPRLARLTAEYPLRERLVELHMRALHRDGRPAEALDAYRRFRTLVGAEPGTALQEVQAAVLRGADRPPAAPPPAVVPAQLPPDGPWFAGRGDQLRRLDAILAGTRATAVVSAIAGTAGVGKTTLAVHWAHRVRDRFPDGQLYANLRGFDPGLDPVPPTQVIRQFLDALDVPPQGVPAGTDAQRELFHRLLADRRVLVLLDNARDAEQVRPLLPAAPGCFALVTSRNELADLAAAALRLDLLTAAEARDLLAARIGAGRVAAEPRAVDDLVGLSARLPLALAIVAARAAIEPDLPLAELAARVRAARDPLDGLAADDDVATNLRAAFACSYRILTPPAARLFRLLGLHPGPDLSAPAAASLADIPPAEVGPLREELSRAHLVTGSRPGRYSLHDLLRAFAAELAAQDATDPAIRRMLDHYLHSAYPANRLMNPRRAPIRLAAPVPGVTPETFDDAAAATAWFRAESAVLIALVRYAADHGHDRHTWQLAWSLLTLLERQLRMPEWIETQTLALDAVLRVGDPSEQTLGHRLLGRAFAWFGRVDEAQVHLERALELCDASGDLRGQANGHYGLVTLEINRHRYDAALNHARRALALYRTLEDRSGEAGALNTVGFVHGLSGRYRRCLLYCRQALGLYQELGNPNGEAETWDSLGYAHHHLGQYGQAIACYRGALTALEGTDNQLVEMYVMTRLGDTHRAIGDLATARSCWQHALGLVQQIDHPQADELRDRLRALDGAAVAS